MREYRYRQIPTTKMGQKVVNLVGFHFKFKYRPAQVGQPNLEKSENLPELNMGKSAKTEAKKEIHFLNLGLI